VKAYKGFDKNMQCRGFQYEVGKTYETKRADLCETGFHACESPLDVFGYYEPNHSRYCEVELDGVTDQHDKDSKRCGTKISIGAEIGIPGLVKAHIEYVKSRVSESVEKGDSEAVTVGEKKMTITTTLDIGKPLSLMEKSTSQTHGTALMKMAKS